MARPRGKGTAGTGGATGGSNASRQRADADARHPDGSAQRIKALEAEVEQLRTQLAFAADARLAVDRAAEQRFRLFDANPDAACVVDLDSQCFVQINTGFQRLSGFTEAHLRGRPTSAFDLWVDASERATFYQKLQSGPVLAFTARFRRADGSDYLGSLSANVVTQDAHRYLVVNLRDISEALAAELALSASQNHFASLFQTAPIGIGVVRLADGLLLDVNAALAGLVEAKIATLAGRHAAAALHWPDFAVLSQRLQVHGAVNDHETHFEVPGRAFHARVSARVVDFDGTPCGLFYVNSVEEHHRLELQLRHAMRMQAIGELAGGIAHDFNNLLGGISGFAELLAHDAGLGARAREQTERIVDTVRRASELTRQLVNFSRPERARTEVVDVHDLVHATVAILEQSVDRRVQIDCRLLPGPACVDGDAAQISNALLNLCLNARDAMPAGGRLSISTDIVTIDESWSGRPELEVRPGRYLRLAVADTGTGIDPDVLPRIFDPFFTTKAPGQGTGLGLAGVWSMLRAHHGTVDVTSAPGRGTDFALFLPASPTSTPPTESNAPAAVAVRGNGRVLVCDDEPMLRDLLHAMLSSLGYEVAVAASGTDAINLYRAALGDSDPTAGFDIVLLDVTMPRMSGHDAFLALRGIDGNVRVLLMSGHADHDEIAAAITAGALGVVTKPFDIATLSRRLQEALATRRDGAGVQAPIAGAAD